MREEEDLRPLPSFLSQATSNICFGKHRRNRFQGRKVKGRRSQERDIYILFQISACLGGMAIKSFVPVSIS